MSRVGESTDRESRLVVTQLEGGRNGDSLLNGLCNLLKSGKKGGGVSLLSKVLMSPEMRG